MGMKLCVHFKRHPLYISQLTLVRDKKPLSVNCEHSAASNTLQERGVGRADYDDIVWTYLRCGQPEPRCRRVASVSWSQAAMLSLCNWWQCWVIVCTPVSVTACREKKKTDDTVKWISSWLKIRNYSRKERPTLLLQSSPYQPSLFEQLC